MLSFDVHPGVNIAIQRLSMDELGVARAMSAGQLSSPQQYDNMWLFALRITGTGAAYRASIKEFVYRDPDLYLNDEFLARCNGLSVIWEHPEKVAKLNSEEYARRAVGSVLLPYIQGNEVWGIAKIYDDDAIDIMRREVMSTSPAVVFGKTSDNKFVTLESGQKLFVEGKPTLLDHLAICEQGVWDKGGEPLGVSSTIRGDSNVAETEKEREDRARNDADAGRKLDKLLSGLDSIKTRMDAFEDKERKDGEEREKDRGDRARADRQVQIDAENAEWRAEDPAACAREDAEEEANKKELIEKGEPEESAVDKARADRRTRRDAVRKDAARRDAEDREAAEARDRKDKALKDGGEDPDAMADAARKDSGKVILTTAEFQAMKARLDLIEKNVPALISNADREEFSSEQARADTAYALHGIQAPPPMAGEMIKSYRVRLARAMQKYSKAWKEIDLSSLGADALTIGAGQIYADSMAAGARADDVPDGQYRAVSRIDPTTGMRSVEFFGKSTIFRRFTAPTRRVVGMKTS